jgi:general secretion pathway protein G
MLQQRQQRRSAFTLMEMLIVVAIIVALAGTGGFFVMQQWAQAQKDTAKAQVQGPLTQACQTYKISMSKFPDNLRVLLQKDEKGRGPYLDSEDALIDPWGQPYSYDASGAKNNTSGSGVATRPDIYTTAPDGEVIGNWSDPNKKR